MFSRPGKRSNQMSFKEIAFVVFGTLIFLGVIFGAAIWFLVYGHVPEDGEVPEVECTEEDFSGICWVKKMIQGERASVE